MNKETKVAEGIARRVFHTGKYNSQIQEGQFVNGKLDGYGRTCYEDGDCYIGYFKKGERHGAGKYVKSNGEELVGTFQNGRMVGA